MMAATTRVSLPLSRASYLFLETSMRKSDLDELLVKEKGVFIEVAIEGLHYYPLRNSAHDRQE